MLVRAPRVAARGCTWLHVAARVVPLLDGTLTCVTSPALRFTARSLCSSAACFALPAAACSAATTALSLSATSSSLTLSVSSRFAMAADCSVIVRAFG